MFDEDEEDEDEEEDAGPSALNHQPVFRSAPQDASAALHAAAMVRRIRDQQKAAMAVESPTRAMDALAGGSAR